MQVQSFQITRYWDAVELADALDRITKGRVWKILDGGPMIEFPCVVGVYNSHVGATHILAVAGIVGGPIGSGLDIPLVIKKV
jgi:hypothetical protein